MATIQDFVNAIPDAQDGNVISSDYHNSLKQAIAAMAAQMSGGTRAGPQTLTLFPNFQPAAASAVGPNSPWLMNIGVAVDAATGSNGWIPVYLPDGAVIQSMIVAGAKTAATPAFISMLVQPVADTATTTLILIDLAGAGNPFTLTGTPNIPGAGPTATKDLQTVKNSVNKYLLRAQTLSTVAATVTIHSIRITYTMP